MQEEVIGAVIGETSATQLNFIIDIERTRSNPLEIGEYVAIDFGEEKAIGIITNLRRLNSEIIESLANSPQAVERMLDLAVIPGAEILTAEVAVQGFVGSGGDIRSPRFPTMPGSKVYRNPVGQLKTAFSGGEITIGSLRSNPEVNVGLRLNDLVSRHFSVLAVTGAGKSYTMGVIIDEIMSKFPSGSIVVVDPHQDYYYLRDVKRYQNRVQIFTPDGSENTYRIRFQVKNFSPEELSNMIGIPSNASRQRDLFNRIVGDLNSMGENWDLRNVEARLRTLLQDDERKSEWAQANGLLRRLRYVVAGAFLDRDLETPVASTTEPALTRPGYLTVINTGLLDNKGKETMVKYILEKIFDAAVIWRRGLGQPGEDSSGRLLGPVLIIMEEAHQFVPPKAENSLCKPIIKQIAGEGRKFGIGLGIVSQRPGKIDDNVLSQCNTQITLRIVNNTDQSAIENASETLSKDLMRDLAGLNRGEAVITGSAIRIPALVTIRELDMTPSGADVPIDELWRESPAMDEEPLVGNNDLEGFL